MGKFALITVIIPAITYMIASLFISDAGAVIVAIIITALIASEYGNH